MIRALLENYGRISSRLPPVAGVLVIMRTIAIALLFTSVNSLLRFSPPTGDRMMGSRVARPKESATPPEAPLWRWARGAGFKPATPVSSSRRRPARKTPGVVDRFQVKPVPSILTKKRMRLVDNKWTERSILIEERSESKGLSSLFDRSESKGLSSLFGKKRDKEPSILIKKQARVAEEVVVAAAQSGGVSEASALHGTNAADALGYLAAGLILAFANDTAVDGGASEIESALAAAGTTLGVALSTAFVLNVVVDAAKASVAITGAGAVSKVMTIVLSFFAIAEPEDELEAITDAPAESASPDATAIDGAVQHCLAAASGAAASELALRHELTLQRRAAKWAALVERSGAVLESDRLAAAKAELDVSRMLLPARAGAEMAPQHAHASIQLLGTRLEPPCRTSISSHLPTCPPTHPPTHPPTYLLRSRRLSEAGQHVARGLEERSLWFLQCHRCNRPRCR